MKQSVRTYLMVLFMLFSAGESYAVLNAPALRCVNVQATGDVEISWVIPGDPGAVFDAYLVYYATSAAGPFNLIGTINTYASSSWIHVGANAQVQQGFYYMVTRSDAPLYEYSVPSDTLSSMKLMVSNPLNGTAVLNWNPLHAPVLASSGLYNIYYEFPAGIWNSAGTTSINAFTDTIDICNGSIAFRVEQADAMGCFSLSSTDSDIFQNLIPPDIPVLDSVSVDPLSNDAVLGWQSSYAGDTEGYIIYQFTGGVWTPIDTVWGIGSTFYSYAASNAGTSAESYCIAAIDSCGTTSPLTGGHTTMLLQGVVDPCARAVNLSWSEYSGFPSGSLYYRVLVSENGDPYTIAGTTDSTVTTFVADSLNDGSTYCFLVQAIAPSGFSSSSQLVCLSVNLPDLPSFALIRYVSVETDGSAQICWVVDSTVFVTGYSLQRAAGPSGPWTGIDYKTYSGTGTFVFHDLNANADLQSMYYRLAVIDSCSNEGMYSPVARSLFLKGTPMDDLTNELIWNDYEGWPTGVSELQLFRSNDGIAGPLPVAVFFPGTQLHSDDVAAFYLGNGLFTYRMMALENAGNPYGYADTAWSNVAVVQQWPRLFMANAFAPEGYNTVYCPMGVFIDHSSYEFIIFSEGGEEVFHTTDFFACWDGSNDGGPAPGGVYHYILRLILPGEQEFLKRGHITLIR